MPSTIEGHSSFSALDWTGALLAGFGVLGLLGFPLVGRTYAGMFEDFGAHAALPRLTRLATSVWFPCVLSLPAIASLMLGFRRRPIAQRRLCVVGATVLGWGALALCVVGLYLPIFALAGAVRPR
jgi:hypothetical protein